MKVKKMIILRTKTYSKGPMLDRIIAKLDKDGVQDYDTSTRIPSDSVSITTDLGNLKIYLPMDYEYNQYDIDNFVRNTFGSFVRTTTKQERDVFVMTLSTKLNENQYLKLIKYIIDICEFIVLLES